MEILEPFIKEYYKKLRKGGTLIIFFDIWKIKPLKDLLEKYKFKQIRFIEWNGMQKVIGVKWVFKTKYNSDGLVDREG